MSHTRDVFRRLAMLGLALCVLIAGGTIAYALLEHRNAWDAFIWTIDTVATTGAIQAPHDTAGEIIKVALTFLGVGTLFYALVSLTELVVTGELGTLLSERRARKMTERLRDHYIVCGFGRVGRQVASDLRVAGALYVVVDDDPKNREAAYAPGVRFITARPSDDDGLRDAGIARARAVVACVDSDAENIFITLSARELRPDIVLLDVQLPDIDGFDVAARITGNPDSPAVILVSSRDSSDFGPLVSRSGARGFVPKAELSGAAIDALLSGCA